MNNDLLEAFDLINALQAELEMEQAYRENAERDLTDSAIHAAGIATTLALVTRESEAKDALIAELARSLNYEQLQGHETAFSRDARSALTKVRP